MVYPVASAADTAGVGYTDDIPTIYITGTPMKGLSAWDYIVAGVNTVRYSLFPAAPAGGAVLTPDAREKMVMPENAASTIAPLLAIALAAAGAYLVWKAVK